MHRQILRQIEETVDDGEGHDADDDDDEKLEDDDHDSYQCSATSSPPNYYQ